MKSFPKEVLDAFEQTKAVRQLAHAPYSQLQVGAALKVKGQNELVLGCNVENASYGATICAERTAITRAIATYGKTEWEYMVLSSTSPHGVIPPCGMCLQVLQEFVVEDFPVYLGDQHQLLEKYLFSQLLPIKFRPKMLP